MLINLLLDQFLTIKVSQGSIATRLRCNGIFNDQFITQSLLSPRVKFFWKSINISRSYGQLSTGLWNTVYMYLYLEKNLSPVYMRLSFLVSTLKKIVKICEQKQKILQKNKNKSGRVGQCFLDHGVENGTQ